MCIRDSAYTEWFNKNYVINKKNVRQNLLMPVATEMKNNLNHQHSISITTGSGCDTFLKSCVKYFVECNKPK